jgi:hypothetical protein
MKHPHHHWLFWLWLFAAGITHAQENVPPPAVPQMQQAETLIEGGKPEQAYNLLEPLESQLAGNIQYDYLLGVSALNSGKASLAVFAFERVQATGPGYKDIDLWLSIAYYQSGNRERAKTGFATVIAQSNNAEAKAKAERFLSAIRQEETGGAGQPSLLGKVEIGFGHDSNITNNSLAYLGALQLAGVLPAPASNQAGMESILNLGVEGRIPVYGNFVFASVDDDKRIYRGNGVMNSDTLVAKGGMDFASNGNTYKVSLSHRRFSQQGTFFAVTGNVNDYAMSGAEGRARFQLSAQDYLGFVAQYNLLRFLAINTEDTNQVMLGVNYMHLFQAAGNPVFYFGYANLGDRAIRTKSSYNPLANEGLTSASRDTDILTLYLQYSISKEVDIVSTDYVYFRRDSGAFARDAVIDYGKDKTSFLSLGINWRPRPQWTVRSQLAKTSNNSNIALYAYRKTEATVILRREFN